MSETVLNAIIQLFALVAKEDGIAIQERRYIESFLSDRLNQRAVHQKLKLFDQYTNLLSGHITPQKESEMIYSICFSINKETTKKQKMVVIAKLMSIILADGKISEREEKLARQIGATLNIRQENIELIKTFLLGTTQKKLDHENILIIDSTEEKYGACRRIFKPGIDGFIAFLYIRSVNMYFFEYIGKTDVFLNGVPKKPNSISVLAIGSTIRWGNTDPIYYGDILIAFKEQNLYKKLNFEAVDISYTFKNGNQGLQKINLIEESGKLIAIMGASGSGKSTLLHVLNGMLKPSEGSVSINGVNIHEDPDKVKGIIGFVPQDDMLIEDLTVYENLYFAAEFCFRQLSKNQVNTLVTQMLTNLGLMEIATLKVGSVLKKMISGGQRKRLNIALELLREPAILFCDEPTSGLSSRDSENIIDLLKELSLKGKLVFVVIHQPSSDIFKMFDKLIILDTGGYQIYYGNPIDAVTYFKKSINLINKEQGECPSCGTVSPEQIFNIIEAKVINEYGNFTNDRKLLPEYWVKKYEEAKIVPTTSDRVEQTLQSILQVSGWFKQTRLFSSRDILAKLRNRQYVLINFLEAPLLAFVLAFITRFYNPDDPEYSVYLFGKNINIPAYFFMSMIAALFMGLTVSAEEIIRDRKILKREMFLHLNRSSYLASKLMILFTLSAIQTASFVLIGNSILEIKGMFFPHWIILFSTSCFANLLGLNISSSFNSAVTIYILIPILLIPQIILSGGVVKFDKLSPAIGSTETVPFIGNITASRWGYEAAMVTQFKDNRFEKIFYPFDKLIAECSYKDTYYIPQMESTLQRIDQYHKNPNSEIKEDIQNDFAMLRHEIKKELYFVGQDRFTHMDELYPEQYSSGTFEYVQQFFTFLKQHYTQQYETAMQKKDSIINNINGGDEKSTAFGEFKNRYHNEALSLWVKNLNETSQIIRSKNKLIQKIFPIYRRSNPNHTIDLSAQFYTPKKYFIGYKIDTLVFNIVVLWSMTCLMMITLYYDVLRKIINGLSRLPS